MKKILIFLLLLAVTFVTGCSDGNDGEINLEADESKKCNIEFYVYDNKTAYEKLAAQFNKLYPNWTISIREDKAEYFDHLKTYFGAGMAPDMFFMESGEIGSFIREGDLLNLQPFIDNGTDLKESDLWEANDGYRYNEDTGKLGAKDGDLYALAKDLSADYIMVYNKSHIDEYNQTHDVSLQELIGYPSDDGVYPSETIPMTWAQNEEFCYRLAKFDSNGGFERYGTVFDYTPWRHVMEWVQQQGASLFSEDGKTFNATDERVIAAFQHLTNYCYGPKASSTPLDTHSVDTGIGFKSGSVSVVWAGRWSFRAYDWYDLPFEYGVAPGAVRYEGDNAYTTTCYVGISISSTCKNPAVAYKFLEYILTAGVRQEIRTGESFNVPSNYTIASSDAYLNSEDESQNVLNRYFYNMTKIAEPLKFSQYINTSTMESKLALNYGYTWNSANHLTPAEALLKCKKDIETEINKVVSRL